MDSLYTDESGGPPLPWGFFMAAVCAEIHDVNADVSLKYTFCDA